MDHSSRGGFRVDSTDSAGYGGDCVTVSAVYFTPVDTSHGVAQIGRFQVLATRSDPGPTWTHTADPSFTTSGPSLAASLATAFTDAIRALSHLAPALLGLFGGAGATLLWEGVLKPRRERRMLARALGTEVGLNMQMVGGALSLLAHRPNQISLDFSLSAQVFQAVSARIGELEPVLLADLVVFYQEIQALDRLPKAFSEALDEYRRIDRADHTAKERSQRFLDSILTTYRMGLERTIRRGNQVLPKLRRTSRPLLLRWKRGPTLDSQEMDRRVSDHLAERKARGGPA